MAMRNIHTEEELQQWVEQEPAALLLFGGANCSVCSAIQPRLQQMLESEFPNMAFGYTACDGEGLGLCAANGLFSIPVIWLYFEGKRFQSFARIFSLHDVRAAIEKPYEMMFSENA